MTRIGNVDVDFRGISNGCGAFAAAGHLTDREGLAADELIRRVISVVPARLRHAVLFGSKARREAGPDSDVDVLFLFERLPPDREPHASVVEDLAEEVSAAAGFEVSAWSVSLVDLQVGMRTPMLVDALRDAVPLWPRHRRVPRPVFTPADALSCSAALLERVEEGSREAAELARCGDEHRLARRMRDDLVRLCTASLLLAGETRPRRADAVRRFVERREPSGEDHHVLRWASASYGPTGRDDDRAVQPPDVGFLTVAATIERIRSNIVIDRARLARAWGNVEGNGGKNGQHGMRRKSCPPPADASMR